MRLKSEQLSAHLASKGLSSVYIISGDEPLLVQESADIIRTAAKLHGYNERNLFYADSKFDWNGVLIEASNISLFSEKKFLEIRIIAGKPGDKGSRVLQEHLAKINTETLTLIITPKLDSSSTRSKWFTAIENQGISVQIWPVSTPQLPQWLHRRLNQSGIQASQEAISVLADRVEGNLLSAIQEIEKLKLLAPEKELTGKAMSDIVADSSRFNVFVLLDKIMESEAKKACRILQGLRSEGTDATIILWAITRDLRILIKGSEAVHSGRGIDSVLQQLGVWESRKPLIKKTISRISVERLRQMLKLSGGIDRAIKGTRQGSPWDDLTTLILVLCGIQSFNPRNLRLTIQ
ncbi:MAG: DNA polymerase-3 subunit delta [Porticoccus sp.]|jgi:DNA polymerase-3 subunit delta